MSDYKVNRVPNILIASEGGADAAYKHLSEAFPCAVTAVHDGDEAVEIFESRERQDQAFDLVVLEVAAAKRTGPAVLNAMRNTRNVPAIFLGEAHHKYLGDWAGKLRVVDVGSGTYPADLVACALRLLSCQVAAKLPSPWEVDEVGLLKLEKVELEKQVTELQKRIKSSLGYAELYVQAQTTCDRAQLELTNMTRDRDKLRKSVETAFKLGASRVWDNPHPKLGDLPKVYRDGFVPGARVWDRFSGREIGALVQLAADDTSKAPVHLTSLNGESPIRQVLLERAWVVAECGKKVTFRVWPEASLTVEEPMSFRRRTTVVARDLAGLVAVLTCLAPAVLMAFGRLVRRKTVLGVLWVTSPVRYVARGAITRVTRIRDRWRSDRNYRLVTMLQVALAATWLAMFGAQTRHFFTNAMNVKLEDGGGVAPVSSDRR